MGRARRQVRSSDPVKADAADARWWRDAAQDHGCWLWQGTTNDKGYGTIWNGHGNVMAYVYGWVMTRGELPEGFELDHVCRNPRCVKPTHMEPVTSSVNHLRKPPRDVCLKGHPLVPGNVYMYPKSKARLCVECHPTRRPNWFPDP
jgi:hypothetical protein